MYATPQSSGLFSVITSASKMKNKKPIQRKTPLRAKPKQPKDPLLTPEQTAALEAVGFLTKTSQAKKMTSTPKSSTSNLTSPTRAKSTTTRKSSLTRRTPLGRTSASPKKSSKPLRAKSNSERKKLKDAAWDAFSLYVRTRDSLLTTGTLDACLCITCGARKPRLGVDCIQAGHFIPGRGNAVLFSEDGVHGQCGYCNMKPPRGLNGNLIAYWPVMEKLYGRPRVDELIRESKQTIKYSHADLRAIAEYYTMQTNKLIKNLAVGE